jgi:LysR family hydrogen peroxide-inducible transcriptional activator
MVAAGMGVTLVPRLSVPAGALVAKPAPQADEDAYVKYLPFEAGGDSPATRRVVLVWRRSFTRYEAIAALRNAIYACELPGVELGPIRHPRPRSPSGTVFAFFPGAGR